MNRYDWLLFVHVLAGFAVVAGGALLTIAMIAARRAAEPRSAALALGLIGPANIVFGVGAVAALVFGIWLALDVEWVEITDAWVIAALVLWLVAGGAGDRAVREYNKARDAARGLVTAGAAQTDELRSLTRTNRGLLLQLVSMAAVVALIVLMILKPGA